ncbi:hypothetical protein WJX74_007076 [Apatococcus lobatus]|uniref:Resolvase HTH domain-containing protein n=1 Tax=Apatococcus lobatus TaxID=904363 RepID=A0AAW1QXR1_9CHLO
MPKALSKAECKKIVRAVDRGLTVREVSDKFERCTKTVQAILQRRDAGLPVELPGRLGILYEGRKVETGIHTVLQHLLQEKEVQRLEDLAAELSLRAGRPFCCKDVLRGLKEIGITMKQVDADLC